MARKLNGGAGDAGSHYTTKNNMYLFLRDAVDIQFQKGIITEARWKEKLADLRKYLTGK